MNTLSLTLFFGAQITLASCCGHRREGVLSLPYKSSDVSEAQPNKGEVDQLNFYLSEYNVGFLQEGMGRLTKIGESEQGYFALTNTWKITARGKAYLAREGVHYLSDPTLDAPYFIYETKKIDGSYGVYFGKFPIPNPVRIEIEQIMGKNFLARLYESMQFSAQPDREAP